MDKKIFLILILIMLIFAGCEDYPFASATIPEMNRIAVLKFDNQTNNQKLGENIKKVILQNLPSKVTTEIIDGVNIEVELEDKGITLQEAVSDPTILKDLGARYKIDGIIFGTATYYYYDRIKRKDWHGGPDDSDEPSFDMNEYYEERLKVDFEIHLIRVENGQIEFSDETSGSIFKEKSIGLSFKYPHPDDQVISDALDKTYQKLLIKYGSKDE